MPSHKDRLLAGEPYLADDPELPKDRHSCRLLTEQLNAAADPRCVSCGFRISPPPRSRHGTIDHIHGHQPPLPCLNREPPVVGACA